MDEIDNLSFSTLNLIDSESTYNVSTNRESDDENNQIDLNDNQQSRTKSIDNLLCDDKWILKLNWNFRVELIKLLDEYIRLLVSDKEISIDEKELIKKNKNDLIKLLIKTPLKLDEESNSFKIFINLDNIFKHEIIDQLIKNENLLIDYKDEIDKNLKDKLIEANNHLINKIINLPVEYSNNDVNLVDGDDELESRESESRESESRESESRQSESRESESRESESKDEKLVNDLKTELSNLEKKTIDLKEEIIKLKSKSDDDNSIRLYLVKKDMKKFFEYKNDFYSEGITHLNIEWNIIICSKYDQSYFNFFDYTKYLGFFLYANNENDDMNNVKWKCTTSFELILKNNLPGKQDKVLKYNHTFDRSSGYGRHKFISEDELFNLDNGYIQDDTIKLEVNFKVGKIERNI